MMKKIFVLVCLALFLTGCNDEIEKRENEYKICFANKYNAKPYGSIEQNKLFLGVIDNHEYLFVIGCRGSIGMSHKADCKFCKENK